MNYVRPVGPFPLKPVNAYDLSNLMLNGLEKTLERKLPERDRLWQVAEESALYGSSDELCPSGWPVPAET